jgi:hypothetical protein
MGVKPHLLLSLDRHSKQAGDERHLRQFDQASLLIVPSKEQHKPMLQKQPNQLGIQFAQHTPVSRMVQAASSQALCRPASLVGEIRRARGQISLTEQFKTQAKVERQWTVFGLAQELGVHRNWLYTRILKGTLPATRHAVTGHYLIADEPELLAMLRAQRDRCCYR